MIRYLKFMLKRRTASAGFFSQSGTINLSHDSASRWLNSKDFRPSGIYREVSKYIDREASCLLVGDDTLLSKQYSKKIELVHYQYSGAVHDV
ncbi:hypothetical protein [Candidatus Tisiphia endosymbiont of Parasteatoda lunata]|uniref:hypothetical protein n=1 Tax=Candidatus Tisiphia endosymbiont of Parasteatoda lunata TaxID=3066275 RepID=UPI00313B5CB9